MAYNVGHELKMANVEHSIASARIEKLAATVADQSLPVEVRLIAQMKIDKIFFAQRSRQNKAADTSDDKIADARKRAERKRLARARVRRIAAGLPIRPRQGHAFGTWASNDRADSLRATDSACIVCGKAVLRDRSRTCSPTCARAVRAVRKASVNHSGGL